MGMLLQRHRVDVNATTMADTTPKATEEVKLLPKKLGSILIAEQTLHKCQQVT